MHPAEMEQSMNQWIQVLKENWTWLQDQLYQTFIVDDRWNIYFLRGLLNTLKITVGALLVGVVIGVAIALVRTAYDARIKPVKINAQGTRWRMSDTLHLFKTQENHRKRLRMLMRGLGGIALNVCNVIAKVYLTVIRGTPSTVQLIIIYFLCFGSSDNQLLAAIIAFGINSGAYVSEIIRSGILSINKGQMEAGRSLGMGYAKSMRLIIIPQAVKNILPALGNELIVLLKETSICTVIGLMDLTKGAMIVQSRTYAPWVPYISLAIIYLIIVMILSKILTVLERRMRASDRR